jgi:hypothetical protein
VLELDHLARGFLDEGLHHVLIGEEVAAEDRVLGVGVEAVVVAHDRGRPALGGHGVAAHRIDLREDRDGELGRLGRGGDGRAQPRAAAADDQDVVLVAVVVTGHIASSPPRTGHRRDSR